MNAEAKIEDGGPAFPGTPATQVPHPDGSDRKCVIFGESGMSLRDWFAGQALAGLLACPSANFQNHCTVESAARNSFRFADAMLAERKAGAS